MSAEDVEGLLGLGAPRDEYSAEVEGVAAALQRLTAATPSEPDVLRVLETVWRRSFGPFSEQQMARRSPGLRKVARRIVECIGGPGGAEGGRKTED